MQPTAVTLGLLAMLSWGVWAVLATVATRSLAPTAAMVVSYATGVAVALGYLAVADRPVALEARGVGFALAAGVFAGAGAVAYYAGLDRGTTAVVTTVSALYFVVAAVLGVAVLRESLAPSDVAGVGFAVLAVVLLAR